MDFIIEFILAMFFIFFFKVQKLFFPSIYFTFSDPFIRQEDVSLSKYFFRIFVIFFFNVFFYLILNIFYEGQEILKLLLIASFLGSLFIIWPIIFRPSHNLEGGLSKKSKVILYCIYLTFLFSTLIISFSTTSIMNLFLKDMDILTIFSSNKEGIIFEILMLPVVTVFEKILTSKYKANRNEDDNKLIINNNIDTNYEDYEDGSNEYEEDEYEESKIHYEKFIFKISFITFINLVILAFNAIIKKKRKE